MREKKKPWSGSKEERKKERKKEKKERRRNVIGDEWV